MTGSALVTVPAAASARPTRWRWRMQASTWRWPTSPRRTKLEAVAEGIRARGRRAAAIVGDIAPIETHAQLLDAAEKALGPLTTLVNNAGVSVLNRGDLLDVTPESYDRCDLGECARHLLPDQAFARGLLGRPATRIVASS